MRGRLGCSPSRQAHFVCLPQTERNSLGIKLQYVLWLSPAEARHLDIRGKTSHPSIVVSHLRVLRSSTDYKMPKVTKARAAASPLEAVPMAVESGEDSEQVPEARTDTSGAGLAPEKPKFSPLTAYELNGKKIEFRRVSRWLVWMVHAFRSHATAG